MKINKVSMAIIVATAMLAVSPAVLAQSTNQAGGGARAGAGGGRGFGGRTNQLTVESLDKVVALTDTEKPKVKTALEAYTKAMTEARQADQSERRTKYMAAQQDLDKKLKEILTEDQYKKYEAMPGRRGGRNGQGGRAGRNGGGGGAGGGAGGGGGN